MYKQRSREFQREYGNTVTSQRVVRPVAGRRSPPASGARLRTGPREEGCKVVGTVGNRHYYDLCSLLRLCH